MTMPIIIFIISFIVLLLVCIAIVFPVIRKKTQADAHDTLSSIVDSLVEKGNFKKAEIVIKSRLRSATKKSDKAFLHHKLGECYEKSNNFVYATVEYKTALNDSDEKNEKIIRYSLASALFKMKKYPEALSCYLPLLRYTDIDKEVYLNVGRIYYEMKNYEVALDYLKKLISIDSRHREGIMYLGLTYRQMNNFADSYVLLSQAVKYFPNDGNACFNLAYVCRKRREYKEAHEYLNISVQKPEFKYRSLFESAMCYLETNDVNNALIDLEKITTSTGKVNKEILLNAYYLSASCYEKLRDKQKMVDALSTIIQIDKEFKNVQDKLNKIKSTEQNQTVKDFLALDDEGFIKKTAKVLLSMQLQLVSSYLSQNGNFLFKTAPLNSSANQDKNSVFVYVSKNITVLNLEEIKMVYQHVRGKNSNKFIVITAAIPSKRASEFANTHYIDILNDTALYLLLQRILTIKEKPVSTKFKNLPF